MNQYFISYEELYLIVLIGAIVGGLFGLVPLILGRRRGKGRLGVYGFIASIVGGAISALVGLIVAGIFTWLVLKGKPAQSGNSHSESNASTDPRAD